MRPIDCMSVCRAMHLQEGDIKYDNVRTNLARPPLASMAGYSLILRHH